MLLSSSGFYGYAPFEFAHAELTEFFGSGSRVLYVPYAVTDHDTNTERVRGRLAACGCTVTGMHTVADPVAALHDTDVVYVGGGNSFRLLKAIRELGIMDTIRERVGSGALRYMGSSAGANVATPSIKTTNDMPILDPHGLDALRLVEFQINPHFVDADPDSKHMGETREQRIAEFHEENPTPVVGLREGALLRVRDGRTLLGGKTGAVVFRRGQAPLRAVPGDDLTEMLAG